MKKVFLYFLLACLVLATFSCSFLKGLLDSTGSDTLKAIGEAAESISRASEEITPSQEYYLGRAVAANILTNYTLANDAATEKYLNAICQVIVLSSDKPDIYAGYHVGILETNEINAFATPGGHILVSRGLLNCAKSEDALASILAHEVAHIHLRHSVNAIKSSRSMDAILATTKVVTSGIGLSDITAGFQDAVDEVLTTMVNSGYSQSQEFEADKRALTLMADAGYNPYALLDMLELLQANTKTNSAGFGKTHPTPAKRISEAKANLKKLYPSLDSTTRIKLGY